MVMVMVMMMVVFCLEHEAAKRSKDAIFVGRKRWTSKEIRYELLVMVMETAMVMAMGMGMVMETAMEMAMGMEMVMVMVFVFSRVLVAADAPRHDVATANQTYVFSITADLFSC